jgi:hypothetical protein
MKKRIIIILIACLAIEGLTSPVHADPPVPEMVTMDEAWTVAQNWITLIIQKTGDWGGSQTAEAEQIQEFKRGERLLGYFCSVKPHGFIVIPLRKELAPVKAYSAVSDLDPESDEGMVDLIKGGLEGVLNGIEGQLGPVETVQTADLEQFLEINYRPSWQQLTGDVGTFKTELESGIVTMDYQEGEVMLTSLWHQYPPYNDQCPNMGCTHSAYCSYNQNAKVGCTAVAGGQIMRYWNWPPYGGPPNGNVSPYSDTYDWPNMPDAFTAPGDTVPPCNWPTAQVNAVAELLSEVGQACGMSYGCSASACPGQNMEDVYEDYYRYSTNCRKVERQNYTSGTWFSTMKDQFNLNRPVQYRFEVPAFSHGVVGDGWREIGTPTQQQWHVNYGHGDDGTTMWYAVDNWYQPGDDEYMLIDIYPAQALGSSLSGTYLRNSSFPYRYFDRDATGNSATFESGQNLQFLPDITVTCTSATGGSIRFEGSSSLNTRLFTRGDRSKGIRIYSGAIELNRDGSIKFP